MAPSAAIAKRWGAAVCLLLGASLTLPCGPARAQVTPPGRRLQQLPPHRWILAWRPTCATGWVQGTG